MKKILGDAIYGLIIAALLIAAILFSSGTSTFLYIDF